MNGHRSIVLAGAGRVGVSLAAALHESALSISAVTDTRHEFARELANRFAIPHVPASVKEFPAEYTHCFLAIDDAAIRRAADDIAAQFQSFEGKTFIHLSGAETIEPLECLAAKGARTASFHIMQSFPAREIISVKGCAAAIETDSAAVFGDLHSLALQLSLKPFRLRSTQKALYHCVGVYVSNFLTGNLYAAEKLFDALETEGVSFFEVIAPIAAQTLENAETFGVTRSLSGPAERGAADIIERHIRVIARDSSRDAAKDYIFRTLQILKAAAEKNPDKFEQYREIEKTLRGRQFE